MTTLAFSTVRDVTPPRISTAGSAGIDFFVPNDVSWDELNLPSGAAINIPSGIRVRLPESHALVFFNKSGQAVKKSLQVGACVVDEDYQGEVHLHVVNVGRQPCTIRRGEKLVQALLLPIPAVSLVQINNEDLHRVVTARGTGGFGSTGS